MKERGNVKLEERVFVELVESCGENCRIAEVLKSA